jgi:hypothetical protein
MNSWLFICLAIEYSQAPQLEARSQKPEEKPSFSVFRPAALKVLQKTNAKAKFSLHPCGFASLR